MKRTIQDRINELLVIIDSLKPSDVTVLATRLVDCIGILKEDIDKLKNRKCCARKKKLKQ